MTNWTDVAAKLCEYTVYALFLTILCCSVYAMLDTQFYCDWTGYRYAHLNCK